MLNTCQRALAIVPWAHENMLWAMLESQIGSSRRNDKGDDIGDSRYYGSEDIEEKLWKHTEEEMQRALV